MAKQKPALLMDYFGLCRYGRYCCYARCGASRRLSLCIRYVWALRCDFGMAVLRRDDSHIIVVKTQGWIMAKLLTSLAAGKENESDDCDIRTYLDGTCDNSGMVVEPTDPSPLVRLPSGNQSILRTTYGTCKVSF